jgi:nitrate/nitrite transport system ATP-binding protein
MPVDIPRPRTRKALLEHPRYYDYRAELLTFLEEYEGGARPRAEAALDATDEAA